MVHGIEYTRQGLVLYTGRSRAKFDRQHAMDDMLHPVPGGVQVPKFRDSSRAISCKMTEGIADIVAAHEEELRDTETMWENSIRDMEIKWQDRLEITVSELSDHDAESKIRELERDVKMIREWNKAQNDQLEKLQEENAVKQQQLDKFQEFWGSLVDKVADQVSSKSSSQGP